MCFHNYGKMLHTHITHIKSVFLKYPINIVSYFISLT